MSPLDQQRLARADARVTCDFCHNEIAHPEKHAIEDGLGGFFHSACKEKYDRGALEVTKALVLSTAHLPQEECDSLDGRARCPLACWANDEYGSFVYVGDGRDAITNSMDCDDWPALLVLCDWAKERGFDWIRFDRDGPVVPGLPVFDWDTGVTP